MKEVCEGETLTFNLAVVDGDESGIIFSASNLPDGASFDQEGGVFTWTPGYDQAGVYDGVRFEMSDGVFMDCEEICIHVIDVCPRWDVNEDGIVDMGDYELVRMHFNEDVDVPGPRYDVNEDGRVDVRDMIVVIGYVGEETGGAVVTPTPTAPSPTPTPVSSITISSGDGLKLALGSDGNVEGIMINDCLMPMLITKGGFSFREVLTDAPNLIANPGFEEGSDAPFNWSFVTTAGNTPVYDVISHSGEKSIKISISRTSDSKSGYPKSDLIKVESLQYFTFSAWGKTESASGTYAPAVRVVELDTNRKWLRQTNLRFSKGTNDWTEKQITFQTGINTSYLHVYSNIWNGYGTFWVDDIELSQFFGPTIYLNGTLTKNPDGTVTQRAQANDIDFTFQYISNGRYVEIQGDIQDRRGVDRALQVMYNLPVNLTGWYWNDDANNSRVIIENVQYHNIALYKQWQNRYLFASIHNGIDSIISVAVPELADVYIGYNTNSGYYFQQDFSAIGINKINSSGKDFGLALYITNEPTFNKAREKYNLIYPLLGSINEQDYLYIIYKYGVNIYMKNGNTGEIENSGSTANATSLIQYALNNVKPDRKKNVALIGNFTVSGLNVKNNTVLDLRQAIIFSSGNTVPLRLGYISNSEIVGGIIDCDSQIDGDTNMRYSCINLVNTDNVTIDGTEVKNGGYYGINLWQTNNNTIKNVYSHDNFRHGIHLGSDAAGRGWYNTVQNSFFKNNGISGLDDRGTTILNEKLYNTYFSITVINNGFGEGGLGGVFISGGASTNAIFNLTNITASNNFINGMNIENASFFINNLIADNNTNSGINLRGVKGANITNLHANDNGQTPHYGGIKIVDLNNRSSANITVIGGEVKRNWRNLYVSSKLGTSDAITFDSVDAREGMDSNVFIYGANVTMLNVNGYP